MAVRFKKRYRIVFFVLLNFVSFSKPKQNESTKADVTIAQQLLIIANKHIDINY